MDYACWDSALKSVGEVLNSNFMTSFWGAVAGSFTIILIERRNRKRRLLADINAAIGILTGLINTYLMIKRQHVLPLLTNFHENREFFAAAMSSEVNNSERSRRQLYLRKLNCPSLHFDLPLERLFEMTTAYPQMVQIIMQAKVSTGEVEDACRIWNEEADRVMALLSNGVDPASYCFGGTQGTVRNSTFEDSIKTIESAIDDSLFFSRRAIDSLRAAGLKSLPRYWNKKIIKLEIDDVYRPLMPAENHKAGWV